MGHTVMIPFHNKGERMKKRMKFIFLGILVLLGTTGCFKRDSLENIKIVTTVYPVEYITNILYGEHSLVSSLYPNETDSFHYELTNKQIQDYSSQDLFIYNGNTDDKDIAFEFLNKNKNLMIIDAAYGMDITYHEAELWLNPSNLLMLSQNIRNGLKEYISNSYLKKEIDKSYETLKVSLSEVDAEFRLTANNASKKILVVNSDALKFLEKYGFEVISLDDTSVTIQDKTITQVKELIAIGKVKHIFLLENEKNSAILEEILKSTTVETSTFRRLDTITDLERENHDTYLTLMSHNIELLKAEVYE